MRGALLAAALTAAACARPPRRPFPVGLLEPVSPRVAAEARRMGLEVAARASRGAAVVSAAFPAADGSGEVAADRERLRWLTARAAACGSAGVFLRLPSTPAGRDLLDYAEEWQAVDRVSRELLAMRPVLQGGEPSPPPFSAPPGAEVRAWSFEGRLYVLLVNPSGKLLPLEDERLAPWRALFSVRSDPRQVLTDCGAGRCLSPYAVLWLEGRLLPEILP